MKSLYTKSWLNHHLSHLNDWQRTSYLAFSQLMHEKSNYPCIFSQIAFKNDQLRFAFINESSMKDSVNTLATILRKYGRISRQTGKYASLVVFFHVLSQPSLKQYEQLFWTILNRLHKLDQTTWPSHIPTDPNHSKWEFCFEGETYFCLSSTPLHKKRKSRYFPSFLLSFQPRWVFAYINNSTSIGRNTKQRIRERLADYDDIAVHPALKWYGEAENKEWKQYFLDDSNTSPPSCPFKHLYNQK
ncbi:YqcI/YcgG family protein [Halalkalibacter hemicellulosilyticus]|uniref:YqcI/YcgG family protein n=1 Tax=Halalkalibacter hemicellulosilyticusJCM 9152 TaxID=1236971 RepID=W4QA60_9BACI|nr:YqcI/YcgG family protein [Halalkalibacter hemicellulosilyticus]GAE28911.1 hypothetical protein JCM9152_249 [Halalkalibacter hemicellulosilyticusJCM 9152]